MIKINDKYSLSYLDGYFLLHEHFINKDGTPKLKEAKTYHGEKSCKMGWERLGEDAQELDVISEGSTLWEQAKFEVAIKAAKKSAEAKKNPSGFAKKA